MSVIAIDFETFYSKKLKYSVSTMIAEQYCNHELFDPYMISVSDGANHWAGSPADFNWSALDGQDILSHNKYFDLSVWEAMHRRGWCPKPNYRSYECTASMTAFLCNRRSLDQAVEHLLKLRVSKTARSDANNKKWPGDFTPAEQAEMLTYARGDVAYCRELYSQFGHLWGTTERHLSNLTIRQGMRGVQIDRERLLHYLMVMHDAKAETEQLIPWIKDANDEQWEDFPTKPTSTKCIAEQCRRVGIPCPPVKSEDEEGYLEWEALYSKDHHWIKALSSWRSLNMFNNTFKKVFARLRPDGTMPFALKYFGAHTGRWSGAEGVNMQNPRKKPIIINERGLMEADERRVNEALHFHSRAKAGHTVPCSEGFWPEWVQQVVDFRSLIIPRPGKKMIVSDLSQIEPRVLAWLAGDTEMLRLLATGMSPYEAHARATMKWTGGVLKKENADMYALAKARVLGLGYQCGWKKFISMAFDLAGIDITKDDPEFIMEMDYYGNERQVSGYGATSKAIVADFRESNKKIVDLWTKLDTGLKSSVGDKFVVKLPSGRSITYDRVRMTTTFEPVDGKPRRKTEVTADTNGRRKAFYGGKITENITQGVARDVFGEHLVAMDKNGWENLFGVHDEAVMEVDNDVTARDVEHAMSKCPEWLPGCPIGAEAQEVTRYTK